MYTYIAANTQLKCSYIVVLTMAKWSVQDITIVIFVIIHISIIICCIINNNSIHAVYVKGMVATSIMPACMYTSS